MDPVIYDNKNKAEITCIKSYFMSSTFNVYVILAV